MAWFGRGMTDSMTPCKGNLISKLYMHPNCYSMTYILDPSRAAAPVGVPNPGTRPFINADRRFMDFSGCGGTADCFRQPGVRRVSKTAPDGRSETRLGCASAPMFLLCSRPSPSPKSPPDRLLRNRRRGRRHRPPSPNCGSASPGSSAATQAARRGRRFPSASRRSTRPCRAAASVYRHCMRPPRSAPTRNTPPQRPCSSPGCWPVSTAPCCGCCGRPICSPRGWPGRGCGRTG